MKVKTVFVFWCVLLGGLISVFGQGQVSFQNSSNATPVRLPDSSLMPAGGGAFSFYFTYGTDPGNLNFVSPTYFNHDTIAGRIAGSGVEPLILATPANVLTYFQLYAYSTSAGSFEVASTPYSGPYYWYQSGIIAATPTAAPGLGTPLFGPNSGTSFQGFTLQMTAIPEPSGVAIGVLGLITLFCVHRRNNRLNGRRLPV